MTLHRGEKLAYYFALTITAYMPLHIFLSQSLSLVTGGLEVWKAAKDVIFCLVVPCLLWLAVKQGALKDRFFKRFVMLGGVYVLLYVLFLLFDKNADTKSAITAAVYNTRPLGYMLLGYVVANSKDGLQRTNTLIKTTLYMCLAVATFGCLQRFLPKDLLTHVGYSLERGVKPMFFIDDKPDFPRVMSTLRDPNSLGAWLVLPIVYSCYYLVLKKGKQVHGVVASKHLAVLLAVCSICLLFTFSRSGAIATLVSLVTILIIVTEHKAALLKKLLPLLLAGIVISTSLFFIFKNSYIVQNIILHADGATVQQDPNELRVSLGKSVVEHIKKYPFGEGPGTAGLVSINNPKGTQLTENYYLQIAYEVGLIGLVLFLAINFCVAKKLYRNKINFSSIVLSVGAGIAVFSLLNHSWSNEALALQWWLFAGLAAVANNKKLKA